MPTAIVIVESPAKAKTLSKFLGEGFDVRASVGHIADLPSKGLSVDVENSFKPRYELTDRGAQVVKELKTALKSASELYVATDEDREGEAIAAHLIEYLKPKIPIRRMVFHEITKTAILDALNHTRKIDNQLVDAAEARRILDRLYGYSVSPILWRKVKPKLSAGRVQSPAIRLVVEREEERMAHIQAKYWDIEATTTTSPSFTATLQSLDGVRIAVGKDFGSTGQAKDGVVVITETKANDIVTALSNSDLMVRSVDSRPYRQTPRAPFITSTLQQEGGNKLRITASEVMRLAQALYENGFITYMRTDNVSLADDAVATIREAISTYFGNKSVTSEPRVHKSKVKNAQEAHEGIRPTLPIRHPDEIAKEVNPRELALYKLIWQRTLSSQMSDATGTTVTIKLGTNDTDEFNCEFSASGTSIEFPGYRQVYQEFEEGLEENEALLPQLQVGDKIAVAKFVAGGHETSPPSRFTEPTLVKKLEELGIGRPSTYASILGTILNRGYVWKKGQALVPSWTAFAVVRLMRDHFADLVDYTFTATVEEELDEISQGQRNKEVWLGEFYFGNGKELPGLKPLVDHNIANVDAATLNTFPIGVHPRSGEEIVLRPGKYGPYVRCGENTAAVPETITPDELKVEIAVELLDAPKFEEPIGEYKECEVFVKTGRFGPYVQLGTIENPPAGLVKPKMVSLFKSMQIEKISIDEAIRLLELPRVVGIDPNDNETITAQNGRFGPYIRRGKESRTLDEEEKIFSITLEEALDKLAEPRVFGKGGRAQPPLKEFGPDPVSGKQVVAKDGKFGTYVTDGETSAGLTRADRLEFITAERAFELLAIRRDQAPTAMLGKKRKAKPTKKVAKKTSNKTAKKAKKKNA